jgi:hypothetical protein
MNWEKRAERTPLNVCCGKHIITILQENVTQADRGRDGRRGAVGLGTGHWPHPGRGRRINEAIYDYEVLSVVTIGLHAADFYSH